LELFALKKQVRQGTAYTESSEGVAHRSIIPIGIIVYKDFLDRVRYSCQ